jgi:hypothetical protein
LTGMARPLTGHLSERRSPIPSQRKHQDVRSKAHRRRRSGKVKIRKLRRLRRAPIVDFALASPASVLAEAEKLTLSVGVTVPGGTTLLPTIGIVTLLAGASGSLTGACIYGTHVSTF